MVNPDTSFKCGWLQAFFDGEGSVVWRRHNNKTRSPQYGISVSNTDPKLIATCRKYLEDLGIEYKVHPRSISKLGRKQGTDIFIYRARSILVFGQHVGFAGEKAIKLRLILGWVGRPKIPKYDPHEVTRLYLSGMSRRNLAAHYNMSQFSGRVLMRALSATGTPVRSQLEGIRLARDKRRAATLRHKPQHQLASGCNANTQPNP